MSEGEAEREDPDVEVDSDGAEPEHAPLESGVEAGPAEHDAGAALRCDFWHGVVLPTAATECVTDSECELGEYQINCCGAKRTTGARREQRAWVELARQACDVDSLACDCISTDNRLDDGTNLRPGMGVVVGCDRGACKTTSVGLPSVR